MFKQMKENRRAFIKKISAGLSGLLSLPLFAAGKPQPESLLENLTKTAVKRVRKMGFQWETADPFLFCVHHEDAYPKGNQMMGPVASLSGRDLGNDFIIKEGFRMYHGKQVPGFPGHPHRGFETITVVRKGVVDHTDSMGAAGRYGNGDVQWMTAGKGVQHAEMFPLVNDQTENPLELFQIWLNLPAKNKMVDAHFKMLWREDIPLHKERDAKGLLTEIEVIAGNLKNSKPETPPPNSWASDPKNEVAVWNIRMEPGAKYTLPAAGQGVNRTLYFYLGQSLTIAGTKVPYYHFAEVVPDERLVIENGNEFAGILMLQGRPIDEEVIQYGPFVMNSKAEIQQAFEDFNKTRFGGWPWPRYDHVHSREEGRFAKHANGKIERKGVV
jgi:quercetin 2,3-dioxygenase